MGHKFMGKRKKGILLVCFIMIITGMVGCGSNSLNGLSATNETESDTKIQETLVDVTDSMNENVLENNKNLEDETEPEITTEEVIESNQPVNLSYNFGDDVENGLLYSTEDGRIVDQNSNVVSEYEYITVLENGALSDGENIMEGYSAGAGGKIIHSIPESVDYGERLTPIEELRAKASESYCASEAFVNEDVTYTSGNEIKQMLDDGGYFDEVVLNAWFDEYGNPKANFYPEKLQNALYNTFSFHFGSLSDYHFIDGVTCTMDSIKRSDSGAETVYALILRNITKGTTSNGEIYIEGIEYTSLTSVIVKGNFDKILNGDDLLVFAKFSGLSANDSPNFQGAFIEIINDRLQ